MVNTPKMKSESQVVVDVRSISQSPQRLKAKYTHRTNQRFVLRIFRPAGSCSADRRIVRKRMPMHPLTNNMAELILLKTRREYLIAALHHNKRKTTYHIHLIFAERKLLDEPIIKIASRNMFYDENGKHVRTKKEILGEDGEIREVCSIVKKGEVYEKKLFTAKDERFKSNSFLDGVKHSYTDLTLSEIVVFLQ